VRRASLNAFQEAQIIALDHSFASHLVSLPSTLFAQSALKTELNNDLSLIPKWGCNLLFITRQGFASQGCRS
jgi:hypothetical protein